MFNFNWGSWLLRSFMIATFVIVLYAFYKLFTVECAYHIGDIVAVGINESIPAKIIRVHPDFSTCVYDLRTYSSTKVETFLARPSEIKGLYENNR